MIGTAQDEIVDPFLEVVDRFAEYAEESFTVAAKVTEWCLENGPNPEYRICLAGYAGESHEILVENGWDRVSWTTRGGYGNQSDGQGRANATTETLWFSPHCRRPDDTGPGTLF